MVTRRTLLSLGGTALAGVYGASTADGISAERAEVEFSTEFDVSVVSAPTSTERIPRFHLNVSGNTTSHVTVRSSSVPTDVLVEMFNGTQVDDGVRVAVEGRDQLPVILPLYFDCAGGGEYPFSITTETGGTDTANLSVVTGSGETSFSVTEYVFYENETAKLGLNVDRCEPDTGTLSIADPESNRRWNVTVRGTGGDEEATIFFEMGVASQRFTGVTGNATLVNRSSPDLYDGSLPPNEYEMTLYRNGSEADVATLVVKEGERPETPTPTPTPSQSPTPTATPTTTPSPTPTVTPTQTTTPRRNVTPIASATQTPTVSPTTAETASPVSETTATAEDGAGFGILVALVSLVLVGGKRRSDR